MNADFIVEVLTLPGPQLLIERQSSTNAQGTDVLLSAAALSESSIAYEWLSNGVPVANAAGPALLFSNSQPAQSAGYQVVVTDDSYSVTSAVAVVTIVPGSLTPSSISVQESAVHAAEIFFHNDDKGALPETGIQPSSG